MVDGSFANLVRKAIDAWALAGGLLLGAIVAVNVWTVLGGLIGLPFAGDFELTQMGVAAAAFMFLPFCQLNRHNVTADIFTANLKPSYQKRLDGLGSVVALFFAALLLWRMYFGMLDQKTYNLASTILQLPVWWVYLPILVSLMLLVLAAILTTLEDFSGKT